MIGRNDANINIYATDKTGRAIASARKSLTGLNTAMRSIGGIGAGFIGVQAIRDIAGINLEFERASREVNSLLNLSGPGFRALQDEIRGVSSAMGIDLVDATKAAYQAISAGVNQKDLSGFLRTAAQASVAGLTDTETAVDVLSTVVNSFGEDTINATRAADVLFSAVKDGKTTFGELARSLSKAAPLAAATGVDFEELAAAAAAITKRGAPTAEAMTQIRAIMVALKKPTTEMSHAFQSMGVANGDALIKAHGLKGALDLLTGTARKNGIALTQIFAETEALNGVLNLTGQNAGDFGQSLTHAYAAAGSAADAFAQNNQTTLRSMEKLKASWQALVTEFSNSTVVKTTLDSISESLNNLSSSLNGDEAQMRNTLDTLREWQSNAATESTFSKIWNGSEKARIRSYLSVWEELGTEPKTYAEAISLLETHLKSLEATSTAATDGMGQGLNSATAAAQGLSDTTGEVIDKLQTATLDRLGNSVVTLREQYAEMFRSTAQKIDVAKKKADDFAAALARANKAHDMEASLSAEESLIREQIKLQRLKEQQATEAQRKQDAAISSLGIGSAVPDPTGKTPAADPYVYGRAGHLFQDYQRNPAASGLPAPGAPAAAAPPIAASPESTAADAIKSALKNGVGFLAEIEQSVKEFIDRLKIAEQQIANAR